MGYGVLPHLLDLARAVSVPFSPLTLQGRNYSFVLYAKGACFGWEQGLGGFSGRVCSLGDGMSSRVLPLYFFVYRARGSPFLAGGYLQCTVPNG